MTWETFAEGALIVLAFACWGTVTWVVVTLLRGRRRGRPIVRRGETPVELPPAPGVPDVVPDWMMKEERR